VRKIENNKLTDPPILAEDVDKVRSIIAYYDSLTIENNTKDIDLLKLLEEIKFDSTGKNNLSNDDRRLYCLEHSASSFYYGGCDNKNRVQRVGGWR
jgi:hypothetical protein